MKNLTASAQRAIAKYGIEACHKAYKLHQAGESARTIAIVGPDTIKTTRQADAAINAGFELNNA